MLTESKMLLTQCRAAVICQRMGVTVTQKAKSEFAAKLQAWREREGYSQRDAAAKLEMSKRTLQGWESGTKKPIAMVERMVLEKIAQKKISECSAKSPGSLVA